MNERERADALARAIDDLINGPFKPEPEFQDEELRSLLRVAQARLQESTDHGRHAADHEAAVWRRLVARIGGSDREAQDDPPLPDSDDLRDAVSARQQMSDEMLQMAEQHREEVWRRLQGRLGRTSPKARRGIFPFRRAETADNARMEGPPASRTRLVPTGDSDVDSLLHMAVSHDALREAGEHTLGGVQAQIRQRMRSDPGRRHAPQVTRAHRAGQWPGIVAMGAVALMIIALAAPVTATGLTDSPAAQAFDWMKEHLGINETRQAPPPPGPSNPVTGVDTTAASAGALLGLPLSAPDELLGLPRASQRLFPQGMTSAGAGVFVASYVDGSGASLALYEEAAGGSDIAIPDGSAIDTVIGGADATYFEGSWSSDAGALAWVSEGTQTLVFERDRVRYVLQYVGARIKRDALIAAGEAVLAR